MRALALVCTAFVAIGCNPASSPSGSTSAADTAPPTYCVTSLWALGVGDSDPSGDNPWAGLAPGYAIPVVGTTNVTANQTNTYIFGFDATMTKLLWYRVVLGQPAIDYYENLPDTIPLMCPGKPVLVPLPEMGQAPGGDTSLGTGGNTGSFTVCIDPTAMTTEQKTCMCVPQQTGIPLCHADTLYCGTDRDECKTTIKCGTCARTSSCEDGFCVPNNLKPCTGICI